MYEWKHNIGESVDCCGCICWAKQSVGDTATIYLAPALACEGMRAGLTRAHRALLHQATRVRRNKYCILYLSLRKFGKWIFYLFSVWKEAALTHAPHCFTASLDDDVNRLMQRCRHCSDAENCKDILPTFYTGLSLSWLFYYCIASLHCFTRQVVSPGYVICRSCSIVQSMLCISL